MFVREERRARGERRGERERSPERGAERFMERFGEREREPAKAAAGGMCVKARGTMVKITLLRHKKD